MNNYIILGFLIGALLVTVYFFILRRRDKKNVNIIKLSDEQLLEKLKTLIASDRKIEAIKLLRRQRNQGLAEAKDYVDNLNMANSRKNVFEKIYSDNTEGSNDILIMQIKKLLAAGKKIEAIKLVVDEKKTGLKEAKDFVEIFE